MKLYTFEAAPNPRRIHVLLHYKGISLPQETVDLGKGQQFSEAFKAINPACTLPALQLDDGSVLTDTVAIAYYLDSQFPQKPVFGATPLETARILGWSHRVFMDGFVPIAEMLRNQGEFFKDRALPGTTPLAQIPALVERGQLRLQTFWPVLDAHLAQREFMVGNTPSQADIDAFVTCDFAGWVKQAVPENCTHIHRWYQRCAPLFVAQN